jgi:hypothetical protein
MKLHSTGDYFVASLKVFGLFALALTCEMALAGTSATFTTLEAETNNSVYGPLGKSVIYLSSLGGALFALLKGAWLFAGLGIAVAGMMFGTQLVGNSATFGALI